MIHRNHVHGVVDIWYQPQLNAPLDQTPNEIIRIRDYNGYATIRYLRNNTWLVTHLQIWNRRPRIPDERCDLSDLSFQPRIAVSPKPTSTDRNLISDRAVLPQDRRPQGPPATRLGRSAMNQTTARNVGYPGQKWMRRRRKPSAGR